MNELENVYREIQPKVFAFFYVKLGDRVLAEDLTHDVFYAAVKGLPSFEGDSSLITWIFSIAKNRLKKYFRSKKYTAGLTEQLSTQGAPASSTPEEIYILKEGSQDLMEHINKLEPPTTREIVILRIYAELSFKEIANLIGESENFARVTFHRAKIRLKKEMRVRNE
ncbi:MAG TPA: sigma-70 family RNA polymerase sigma factor [Bacillus bacterium]|uniref:RNA polymerase sigma factor n=1 Tax=Siminovitchia fordii TaxID=254759 RepID=UPI00037280A0|nr:sigma-70 family RNA polymerase sigma factor [Siminovitchia fordii]HBZ11942.1 sigma-70 family RNA polymerase sigma factor [Bacillus sp. (in: firmicutes)]